MIRLDTERLTLLPPQRDDLEDLVAMMAPEAVRRHLGDRPASHDDQFARLLRNAGSWALYGYGTFMLRRHGAPGIIGVAGVFHSWRGFAEGLDDVPEAGWILAETAWGQGLAAEAMRAVLAWFDATHGPRRIACMIEEDNAASLRLAERLGFVAYGDHVLDDRRVLLLERKG